MVKLSDVCSRTINYASRCKYQSCIKRWNREPSSQKDFTIFKFSQKLFEKADVENDIAKMQNKKSIITVLL